MAQGITIAVDAMSGDYGPEATVAASCRCLRESAHLRLVLVGDRAAIEAELAGVGEDERKRVTVEHAGEVIAMDDKPSVALRAKKDASMRVAVNLVREQRVDACVSAGNTGALMAISRFVLKTHPLIDRPAIVSAIPTINGHCHLLDLGANVDCSAEHLFQFAQMGSIMARHIDGLEAPRVALLNIGEEEIKGNDAIKQASELLSQAPELNYSGYIEGDGIFKGQADVVVCDGFSGNVALKTSEGVAQMVAQVIRREMGRGWWSRLLGLIATPLWRRLSAQLDTGRHNGASLMGLRGIVVKSHGNARGEAFANAVKLAALEVKKDIPGLIHQSL